MTEQDAAGTRATSDAEPGGPDLLQSLVRRWSPAGPVSSVGKSGADTAAPAANASPVFAGVLIGRLVGLRDSGRLAMITYDGQPGPAALVARTVVDLSGRHVGHEVTLMFECADATRPIVTGVLRDQVGWPMPERTGQVEVDADGARLTVSAQHELVLRCGKASLTLRSDGRIELRGESITSEAAAANRIRGGSVQLN